MADLPNGLSHAEAERFVMLAEECGEVIQVVAKILRFSYSNSSPVTDGPNHRVHLTKEVYDLQAVILMLRDDLDHGVEDCLVERIKRRIRFSNHQPVELDTDA